MDETVERVARAIQAELIAGRYINAEYNGMHENADAALHEAARAALSAMPHAALMREALEALQVFETMAHTYDCDDDEDGKPEVPNNRRLRIEETNGDLSVSIVDVGDFRRARAAAQRLRDALTQGEQEQRKP